MVKTPFTRTAFAGSALAVALMLGACGGTSSSQEVMKASTNQKGGFMGLVKRSDVEVTTPAAFKGKQKIVVGGFTVGFDVVKIDSRKAGGGLMGNGFGGKSSAYSKLSGVDNETFQAVTEQTYKDFVAKLKQAGYEVVEPEVFLAHSSVKSAKTYDNPHITSSGGFVTAKQETRFFTPAVFGKNRSFMGSIPGEAGGFGFSNPMMAAVKFAEESKIPVVYVNYKIDFATSDGHGGWASMSSSLQVGQGMTMESDYTKVGIIGGQMGTFSSAVGSMALGQPLSSDKPFAEVVDITTGTDKGLQIATNVIGAIGGIGTNSKRNYEFKSNPSDFKAAAFDVAEDANEAFVGKMQELR